MKVGIFPGKFMPLHVGHIGAIRSAAREVDTLIVVGSYRRNPNVTTIDGVHITTHDLYSWLHKQFENDDHILVRVIDESCIPDAANDGWIPWVTLVEHAISDTVIRNAGSWVSTRGTNVELTVFSNDSEYGHGYTVYLGPCKFEIMDESRTRNPISGTIIRQDLYGNMNYLPDHVQQFFKSKRMIRNIERAINHADYEHMRDILGMW